MDADQAPRPQSDIELLALATEQLLTDGRGRLAGQCGVRMVTSRDGQRLFIGSDVPEALVPALFDAVAGSPRVSVPEVEPPALDACRTILAPVCAPLSLDAGPYYVFEPDARVETRAELVRSDTGASERLRDLNPGNWDDEEWDELRDGTLGPWAMAIVDGRVVSVCHTPGPMAPLAAECGVWTDPAYRGRGYAAAVAATWAAILRPSGRHLFYSTTADNRSSQRVAARLQLRPIGWYWSLVTADPEQDRHRHPLSRRFADGRHSSAADGGALRASDE